MTTPQLPPEAPPVVVDHAAELYAMELAATAAAVGPLRRALTELWGAATRAWIRRFRAINRPADEPGWNAYLADLEPTIRSIRVDVADPLTQWMRDARELGARQAVAEVSVDVDPRDVLPAGLPAEMRSVLGSVDDTARAKLRHAADVASRVSGDRYDQVVREVLAPAQQAVTTAETVAAWGIHRAAGAGVQAVAADLGVERLWIAERDACPYCLVLSGEVSEGGEWDASETFGVRSQPVWPPGPLTSTPRHPRCRCRTTLWTGGSGRFSPDFPAALRREAERSILLGWRLPSSSERFSLQVAAWLLERGTDLPKSVQDRARRSIKNQAFTTAPRRTSTR